MSAPGVFLEIKDLSVTYRGRGNDGVRAVKNCSLSVARGEVVGLVGESGSGKSSLLMSIPKLLPPGTTMTGQIFCDGNELSALSEKEMNLWRWRRIALVPQGAMNSFTPHLSIERHITEVLEHHMNMTKSESAERAAGLIVPRRGQDHPVVKPQLRGCVMRNHTAGLSGLPHLTQP
jgi:peptide/nickel transport system ATP-binding protein